MRTTEKINEIINSYSLLLLEANNLPVLVDLRKDLVVLSYDLGREVAEYKIAFDSAYARRKISYFQAKQTHLSGSLGKAEVLAEVEVAELRKEEKENEGLYSASKIVLNQVNEVLKSMQQDISLLKQELGNN